MLVVKSTDLRYSSFLYIASGKNLDNVFLISSCHDHCLLCFGFFTRFSSDAKAYIKLIYIYI